jgi:hypothetical protein
MTSPIFPRLPRGLICGSVLVLSIIVLSFLRADLRFPFSLHNDEVYQVPMSLLAVDDSLFARDTLLRWHMRFLPQPFLIALGFLLRLLGINTTYLLLSGVLNLVFYVGIYRYASKMLSRAWLACMVCLLSVMPWFSPGIVSYGATTPSEMVPRNIVLALVPWLLYFFVRAKDTWQLGVLFLATGLTANIHPLSAIHLFVVLGLTAVLLRLRRGAVLVGLVIVVAAFLVGALPFIIRYLKTFSSGAGVATETLHRRVPYLFPTTAETVKTVILWLVPYAFMTISVIKAKITRHEFDDVDRFNMVFLGICLVAGAAGIVMAYLDPGLVKFQFYRTWGYVRLILYLYSAAFIGSLLSKRVSRFIIPVCVALVFLPQAAKFVQLAMYSPQFAQRNESLLVGPKRQAFLDMSTECKTQTDKDALFVVPPRELAIFRAAALRSIVVSHKDGAPISFSNAYAEEWERRYDAVENAYARGRFTTVVERYGVDFVVFDISRQPMPPPNIRPLYSNSFFTVYDAQDLIGMERE